MFRYLISPTQDSEKPVLFALTVHNDVVTLYRHVVPQSTKTYILWQNFKKKLVEWAPAIKNYINTDPDIDPQPLPISLLAQRGWESCRRVYHRAHSEQVSFVKDFRSYHKALHSNDLVEDELGQYHDHIRYQGNITPEILNDLLKELNECGDKQNLPKGDVFFNRSLRKAIIKEFTHYLQQNPSCQIIRSNHPKDKACLNPNITIAEHRHRLVFSSSTSAIDWRLDNSTCQLSPPISAEELSEGIYFKTVDVNQFATVAIPLITVSLSAMMLCLFYKRHTHHKINQQIQNDTGIDNKTAEIPARTKMKRA